MVIGNPLTYLAECASGHHNWLQTLQIGVSICSTCGLSAYCKRCPVPCIPAGAPMHPCAFHRHAPLSLSDSQREASAIGRIAR